MTTLHFSFDLSLEILDPKTDNLVDTVRLVLDGNFPTGGKMGEIRNAVQQHFYEEPKIVVVLDGIFDRIIGYYFDSNDERYHVWVQNNQVIMPQRLSNGLVDINPIETTWGFKHAKRGINFQVVPRLYKLYVATESEVALNQLPAP